MSADLSSFVLDDGHVYPGDVHGMTFAIAGDKVLVGWISNYCDGGSPAYTWVDEEGNDLYPDIWGVAGAQKSVDYTLQGFPEVGEIPYSCVWSARGTLIQDPETSLYDIIWTKAERLTSGRRDANRLEMNADGAAGFMMVWQEDPEGLRPGQGLGPGEGWSGAVVNQQTDLWYSYVSVEDFEMVQISDEDETPISIYEYAGDTIPKVAAPMALPIRLTDNKMCKASGSDPYCYIDFDNVDGDGNLILPDDLDTIVQSPESDFCADTLEWTNPGGTTLNLCVAEDGRVMQGRVGASRPRVNVQPYDNDGDGVYDNAWVILGAEESKALGEGAPDETGGGQPDEEEPPDIGKNMWYYSFDMLNPDVVMQGGMLNQPAKCNPYDVQEDGCTLGDFMFLEDPMYEGNDFYETEISRRFSHFSQPIHQMGDSGVSAVLIVKQGIINQGGPADIFLRRLTVPDDVWVECPVDSPYEKCLPAGYNPYAYANMACEEWVYTDGSNPRYVEGLCLDNMINVSGTSIVACDGVAGDCAADFPWDFGDDVVDQFPKVTEWRQCDGTSNIGEFQCEDNDLDDQSWENPYDVAKGHRGFIDGDFIMLIYAWSPNWKANSVGNDHYNLYARRSFDGGETWTTTPAELGGLGEAGDGSDPTACENYGAGSDYTTVCFEYAAGAFEQSRNLSQLTGNKETILDPRYTPSGGVKMLPITDLKEIGFEGYDDDIRDPSKFFIVYETGDNTTVAEGEAIPLDLFYSRATSWGDDYDLVEYYNASEDETTLGFDWLEHDREDLSGEAANTANNAGTFYYAIWNQWQEDEHENVSESDAIFRRVWFSDALTDSVTSDLAPVAKILYTSHDQVELSTWPEGEEVILVGTGRDLDRIGNDQPSEDGIDNARWWSDSLGHEYEGRTCKAPPNGWIPGKHDFNFAVQDNEGNWSTPQTVTIWVADKFYNLFMPVVTRQ